MNMVAPHKSNRPKSYKKCKKEHTVNQCRFHKYGNIIEKGKNYHALCDTHGDFKVGTRKKNYCR